MKPPSPRTIALIVGLLLLAALAFAVPSCLQQRRSERAQARVDNAQAQAAQDNGKDAIATVAASGEASAASEEMTRTNEQAIRAAPGADERVNIAVHSAGLRALCARKAFANNPDCKVFRQ